MTNCDGVEVTKDDELDAIERDLRRKQRLRLLAGLGILAVLATGVIVAYALWPNPPEPRCKYNDAYELVSNHSMPGELVYRACRLPAPLANTLKACQSATQPQCESLTFSMVADQAALFAEVCKDIRRRSPPRLIR
jgi:hypothetical protein